MPKHPKASGNTLHFYKNYFRAKTIEELKTRMELSLAAVINWMKDSGLQVNEEKTELCLFHRIMPPTISLKIGDKMVTTSPSMNVLGVTFDATLKWTQHIESTLKK